MHNGQYENPAGSGTGASGSEGDMACKADILEFIYKILFHFICDYYFRMLQCRADNLFCEMVKNNNLKMKGKQRLRKLEGEKYLVECTHPF